MPVVSLKLPDSLLAEVRALADRKGVSRSSVIREALASYLPDAAAPAAGSFADQARDLAGSLEGPADLAANPAYLDGYGG
jgi:Arc/MetJ-type ribon-helix-helix transcriptional regulator